MKDLYDQSGTRWGKEVISHRERQSWVPRICGGLGVVLFDFIGASLGADYAYPAYMRRISFAFGSLVKQNYAFNYN